MNFILTGNNTGFTGNQFMPLMGGDHNHATEGNMQQPVPLAFDISLLYVKLKTAPGVGNSFTFTLRKNGGDTALALTISDNATSGQTAAGTNVSLVAGDLVCINVTMSGAASIGSLGYSARGWNNSVNSQVILGATSGNPSTSSTYYSIPFGPGNASGYSNTESAYGQFVVPAGGSFSKFYVRSLSNPGTGKSYTYKYRKNAADTSLAVTIADSATSGSDTSNSVSVAAGDLISISVAPSGTPTASPILFGSVFTPTNYGDLIYGTQDGSPANGSVSYTENAIGLNGSAFESSGLYVTNLLASGFLRNLYGKTYTAPGNGKNWNIILQKSDATTSLSLTIADLATTGNVASDVLITDGDHLNLKITPTGSPATPNNTALGYLFNMTEKRQTATANIIQASIYTKTQTGTAKIATTVTKTQTAKAFIVNLKTKDQTAKAHITATVVKTQTAKASLKTGVSITQSAVARIEGVILDFVVPPKKFAYKVYDKSGTYLGEWNDVITEFGFTQEINAAGPSIDIELARNSDTLIPALDLLTAEDGTEMDTESNIALAVAQESSNKVGPGTTVDLTYRVDVYVYFGNELPLTTQATAHITDQSGNDLDIDYGSPNGRLLFSGEIYSYSSRYGNPESTLVSLRSYGYQLDQYVMEDGNSVDVKYNSYEPADILRNLLDDFNSAGGLATYSDISIENSGTAVSYTFHLNTYLEGVQKVLELSPSDWLWYYDAAYNKVYLRSRPTTPTHTFVLGKHIKSLVLKKYIEDLVNTVYFSGGDTDGLGNYLFRKTQDGTSVTAYGQGLDRQSDSRVTLYDTADILSQSEIDRLKDPRYQSTVEIQDGTYIIEDIQLGELVAFRGFGNFIDGLTMQIVAKDYNPNSVMLQLDSLLPRINKRVEDIKRNLDVLNSTNTPDVPA